MSAEKKHNHQVLFPQHSSATVWNFWTPAIRYSDIRSRYITLPVFLYFIFYVDRYVELREGQLGRVSCFGACPHASPMNVTWCVHLYNPIEEVKVCLNMNGIVNQTSLAAELQLGKRFAMKEVSFSHRYCIKYLWFS